MGNTSSARSSGSAAKTTLASVGQPNPITGTTTHDVLYSRWRTKELRIMDLSGRLLRQTVACRQRN